MNSTAPSSSQEAKSVPITPAKRKRAAPTSSKGGRGSGFSQREVETLLDLLDAALPLCTTEWEAVVRDLESHHPGNNRTVERLKRKFASLHRKKMPTGDPLMPPEVKRAKHIRYKTIERADIGECDNLNEVSLDEDDDAEGFDLVSSALEWNEDGESNVNSELADDIGATTPKSPINRSAGPARSS